MSSLLGNSTLDHAPFTLRKEPPAITGPFLAPKLAMTITPRHAELAELRDHLTSGVRSVALSPVHGLQGVGLRTLAAAACHMEDIAAAFEDGILWANVRRDPQAVLGAWAAAFGLPEADRDALRAHLAGRRVLVVLSGVNDPQRLRPYALGGRQSVNLVLSSHPAITERAQVRRVVGVLHPDHAVAVLQAWANDDDAPRQTVSVLAWQLGYQALPLALIGALVPVLGGWRRTLEAVERQGIDLSRTEELTPTERLTQLYAVFNLCFATLPQREQAHAQTLAASAAPLTLAAIGQAWGFDTTSREGTAATHQAVNALRRRAILDYGVGYPLPTLRMHPLLRDYCLTH